MNKKEDPNNFVFTEYGAKRDITPAARVRMYKALYNLATDLKIEVDPKAREAKVPDERDKQN